MEDRHSSMSPLSHASSGAGIGVGSMGEGPLSAAAMGTVGGMTGETVAFVSPSGDVVHVP